MQLYLLMFANVLISVGLNMAAYSLVLWVTGPADFTNLKDVAVFGIILATTAWTSYALQYFTVGKRV